jgi:hypothetical protein
MLGGCTPKPLLRQTKGARGQGHIRRRRKVVQAEVEKTKPTRAEAAADRTSANVISWIIVIRSYIR